MSKFCSSCVMPIWDESAQFGRPGLGLSEDGQTCVACARAKAAKSIDWNARYVELEKLCDRHRKHDGSPDVIVPVSGGKDSHYQVWLLRRLGMHPLLVTVRDAFGGTEAGRRNIENLEKLGCGLVTWRQNPAEMHKMSRQAFEQFGAPTWPIDQAIYAVPPRLAAQFGIPLVVYGENISWTYGGSGGKDEPSAYAQIENDVVRRLPIEMSDESREALKPSKALNIEPIYLSYYVPWDGFRNAKFAESIGFTPGDSEKLEDKDRWLRNGFAENYDQIDSLGYCVHPQMKWVKFGAARVSDVCSNLIRGGYMSRSQAVERVRNEEGYFDERAVTDFCDTLGYDTSKFREIVGRHRNPVIFAENYLGYDSLRPEFQIGG